MEPTDSGATRERASHGWILVYKTARLMYSTMSLINTKFTERGAGSSAARGRCACRLSPTALGNRSQPNGSITTSWGRYDVRTKTTAVQQLSLPVTAGPVLQRFVGEVNNDSAVDAVIIDAQ